MNTQHVSMRAKNRCICYSKDGMFTSEAEDSVIMLLVMLILLLSAQMWIVGLPNWLNCVGIVIVIGLGMGL